jgi:hypothetical protein
VTCPVCRRDIKTNAGGINLAYHRDKVGQPCPASGITARVCWELLEDMA